MQFPFFSPVGSMAQVQVLYANRVALSSEDRNTLLTTGEVPSATFSLALETEMSGTVEEILAEVLKELLGKRPGRSALPRCIDHGDRVSIDGTTYVWKPNTEWELVS